MKISEVATITHEKRPPFMSHTRTSPEKNRRALDELWQSASRIEYSEPSNNFAMNLYERATRHRDVTSTSFGLTLAALFDLAVSGLYLERLVSAGWYSCGKSSGPIRNVYPFVNACPICSLNGNFTHIKAKKPESASIGQATSKILCAFLDLHVRHVRPGAASMRIVGGNGLVDAVLRENKHFALFEIKSAPLIAFPLEAPGARLTDLDDFTGEPVELADHSNLTRENQTDCSLIIDEVMRIPVGNSSGFASGEHYESILQWLDADDNFKNFVNSWQSTFSGYAEPSKRTNTYWLTNGCGVPVPRPPDWPARRGGTGAESISDGKSSVGLDRTDDVKKGIYQVLKISTTFKEPPPSNSYKVSAVLASNIHAVKHHEDYLSQLEDLVWSVDGDDFSYVTERNQETTAFATEGLHNLFDGLLNFTSPHYRDEYLEGLFDFE